MSVNNVLSLHCVAAGNNYCEGIVMTTTMTSEVQRKKSNVGQVINTVVIVVR